MKRLLVTAPPTVEFYLSWRLTCLWQKLCIRGIGNAKLWPIATLNNIKLVEQMP